MPTMHPRRRPEQAGDPHIGLLSVGCLEKPILTATHRVRELQDHSHSACFKDVDTDVGHLPSSMQRHQLFVLPLIDTMSIPCRRECTNVTGRPRRTDSSGSPAT